MWPLSLLSTPLERPYQALVTVFVAWKSVLILVAICSPGTGYDSSTELMQQLDRNSNQVYGKVATALSYISAKLTRWDAIYFTTVSRRGYVYEQEWAFGWGFTRLINFFSRDLRSLGFQYDFLESFVGISIAHASHCLAVLTLYNLAKAVFPGPAAHRLAFVAACLHVFSPAGMFLSAPYSESTFDLLNFAGSLFFANSFGLDGVSGSFQDISLITSGLVLGIGITMRGNGLLNGLIFLEEALRVTASLRNGISFSSLRRLVAAGLGGIGIFCGFLLPQWVAYQEFCRNDPAGGDQPLRIWCQKAIPSIYAFVQDHYWNNGFLRYYKMSNAPLFLIASPMLLVMAASCFWVVEEPPSPPEPHDRSGWEEKHMKKRQIVSRTNRLLHSLAIPQMLLALLTLTTYHVQIITRTSSGYPLWHLWIASMLVEQQEDMDLEKRRRWDLQRIAPGLVLKFMIIYSLVQGGLFASFLPPA